MARTALALILVFLGGIAGAACTTEIHVDDAVAQIDSIGPALFDGEKLTIHFSSWDADGGKFNLVAEYARGEGDFSPIRSLEGQLDGFLSGRSQSTPQVLIWSLGDEARASEPLRVRLGVRGRAKSWASLGPFVPDDLAQNPLPREELPVEDDDNGEGSEPDGSEPDGSEPDGSEPDGSEPDGSGDPEGSN